MAAFIREHAVEAGWWRTVPMLARLGALLLFNVLILRRGHTGEYHFMDMRAVQKLLAGQTINAAYAGQNWFACATKE